MARKIGESEAPPLVAAGLDYFGGMVSSPLLTLLIVPVLYQWFTKE